MPTRRYQAQEVAALRQRLSDAESAPKPAGYTTRQVVRELSAELRMMLSQKHYTVAELATFLCTHGVQIGQRTLSQYLRDEGVVERRGKRGATGRSSAGRARARVQSPDAAVAADETRARDDESAQEGARAPEESDDFDVLAYLAAESGIGDMVAEDPEDPEAGRA